MTFEKFENEINTLNKFFTLYCKNRHKNQNEKCLILDYKNKHLNIELFLCDECEELIKKSFDKLKACPHEEKPRCRKCPNPCYEKPLWKKVSKVMIYSSINLGFSKIKKAIKIK